MAEKNVTELTPQSEFSVLDNKAFVAYDKTTGAATSLDAKTFLVYTHIDPNQGAYGVRWDTTNSSPDVDNMVRIGNMDLHRRLPIQSRMKGCLLNDSGEVVKYLDPNSWLNETRDGSLGQVMVELPMHYRKFVTDGNYNEVWLSEYPLPGYHLVPKAYVSAYEAALNRATSGNYELSSVVNTSISYRGGNNTSDMDNTYRSLLGRPATNISLSNFRTYARNRNNGDTRWNLYTYDVHKELYWLFVVEYATLNSQKAFTAQRTTDGYRQGGLGDGVSNFATSLGATMNWADFNGSNPFVPCGHTDSLGNATGVVNYAVKDENDVTVYTAEVPRYHGIENPFGHIEKWVDGLCCSEKRGFGNEVYVCSDPTKFTSNRNVFPNADGYTLLCNVDNVNGYIAQIYFGENGDITPKIVGGATSDMYYCDGATYSIYNSELRSAYIGGSANIGANAGFIYSYGRYNFSYVHKSIGTRLCFIP